MTSKEDEDIKIVPNIILKPKDFRDRLNLSGIDMRTFDFVYQFMPNCEGKKYCDGCVEDTFAVIELLNDKIRTQERQKTIEMIEKRIKELNKQNLKLGWDGKDWIKDPEILSPNKRDNAYRTTDENIIKIQELQDLKSKVIK